MDPKVVLALDALNSWVRTSGGQDSWGASHVVYWLKMEAIRGAQAEGATMHRRVGVLVKCRGCGGTGHYVDSRGREFPGHYECDSKGIVDLTFVETTIKLGRERKVVWHTPERHVWRLGISWYDLPEHRELDWQPNQKGSELDPDEAARLLNLVEQAIPHDGYKPRYDYEMDREVDDFATYSLWCGTAADCGLCGRSTGPTTSAFRCSTERALWDVHLCERCATALGVKARTGILPCPAPAARVLSRRPPALLSQPNIAEWIRRHPAPPEEKYRGYNL